MKPPGLIRCPASLTAAASILLWYADLGRHFRGISTYRRLLTHGKTPGADKSVPDDLGETGRALNVTEADLDEAREIARTFTLDDTQRVRGMALVEQTVADY